MAEPSKKSLDINKVISGLAGKDRETTIRANKCMTCGGDASKFKDPLSQKEYGISGMCQQCQDKVFGESVKGDIRKLIREEIRKSLHEKTFVDDESYSVAVSLLLGDIEKIVDTTERAIEHIGSRKPADASRIKNVLIHLKKAEIAAKVARERLNT